MSVPAAAGPSALGIDFGTTNTVAALADATGPARLIAFAAPDAAPLTAFRSALSFRLFQDEGRPPERVVEASHGGTDGASLFKSLMGGLALA